MSVEDITLRELSERVTRANAAEQKAAEEAKQQVIREAGERIAVAIGLRKPLQHHRFVPYGDDEHADHCVACRYTEDHPTHKNVPEWDWTPPPAA